MTQGAVTERRSLRVSEVAERIGVSTRTIQNWINFGLKGEKLKATRGGGTGIWLITEGDLDDFMTSNTPEE